MAWSKLRRVTPPSHTPAPSPDASAHSAPAGDVTITVAQADRPPLDPTASFPSRPGPVISEQAITIGHIGRYALKHKLGQGGLGTVYAAYDPLLSRLIAVKTLHVEVGAEQRTAFNALFLREARAAARLSHPQIVTVFDAGISDDRAYIAMELLKGRDLRQLRQEGWRPTPAQAALIVRRVADALAYAHGKGVVHRDIKPANIFMTGRTQPRVLDFGIARLAHERDAGGQEVAAGSPHYMAPEQARHQNVDRRADVFSLGVVLYELLADTKPFRGATLAEITSAVLDHEPPPANAIDPAVPEGLAAIAARAMAKDPARRYRSASALGRELRHWLEEHAASDETEPAPAPSLVRRVAAGAALVGVGAALASAVWFFVPARGLGESVFARAEPVNASDKHVVAAGPAAALPTHASAPAASASPPGPPAATLPQANPTSPAAAPLDAATPASELSAARPGSTGVAAAPLSSEALLAATLGAVPLPAAQTPSVGDARDSSSASPAEARTARTREAAARRAEPSRRSDGAREGKSAAGAATAPASTDVVTGVVRLAVSPWGRIEVDGAPAGIAPPLTQLSLPQGRHRITVSNEDFPPFNASVEVTADQPVTLKYRFGS